MGKKRDRRVTPSSNKGGEQRVELGDSASSNRRLAIIFVLFFVVSPAISVLVYRIKYAATTNPPDSYVFQRGLVKADVDFQEILAENSKVSENTSHWHYTYPVLAYITPCQGAGLILEGRHNADVGWISELRRSGDAWVLPRVVLEAFPVELLTRKKQRDKAIKLIVTECKDMGYDGIVLEAWSRWAAYGILHDPEMRNLALQFIKQLGHALHSLSSARNDKQQLQLVFVIGPPHSDKLQKHDFGPEDLQSLSNAVDGFSLMTYDFSSPQNPGPNAPLKWIRSTLQLILRPTGNSAQGPAHKIFLGINFYGNDFVLAEGLGGGAITGRDYLSLLEKHRPLLQWEKNSGEHLFFYSNDDNIKHAVFYPSLLSISMRLEEARSWGCGISIWEIGQGLDYFFDLL
ncbi:chitinase domain-containing protein 1 isoform X2 [Quercus lobata]|uniref:chitinase domain-containing protein 1 isoform X2 n=1 Tax=Quercus lobata TaxID=97700 RepID=UPI001248EA9A|nr:chitinase domain-containing protein 1 isoform X2 [Quercus lobata]